VLEDEAVSADAAAIRAASIDDLEGMLLMADVRRRRYAAYQPVFWRPAAGALELQRPYLAELLADERVIALVAVEADALQGFVLAQLVGSPAVYDPGGQTCLVDDFVVADPADWPGVGVALLRAVHLAARSRGAAQIVVVTAHLDEPKRAALAASGLSMASEWWVGPA
jgi:GNAT superfamily N-acetyltransferase